MLFITSKGIFVIENKNYNLPKRGCKNGGIIELIKERPILAARYAMYAAAAVAVIVVAVVKKKKSQKTKPQKSQNIKLQTDVDFEMPKETLYFTFSNQDEEVEVPDAYKIEGFFSAFLNDEEQFVILNAPKPINNISFIQACHVNGKIEVEIAVGNGDKNKLFYKCCDEEEAFRIFIDFYDGKFAPELSQYKPVEFYAKA